MRNKRAKGYRKLIGDVSAEYQETNTHMKNFGAYSKPDYHAVSDTINLTEECGRTKYKTLKRVDS